VCVRVCVRVCVCVCVCRCVCVCEKPRGKRVNWACESGFVGMRMRVRVCVCLGGWRRLLGSAHNHAPEPHCPCPGRRRRQDRSAGRHAHRGGGGRTAAGGVVPDRCVAAPTSPRRCCRPRDSRAGRSRRLDHNKNEYLCYTYN